MDGSCLRVDLWGMMPVFDFMIVRRVVIMSRDGGLANLFFSLGPFRHVKEFFTIFYV
ncbi:MAG: hypothetical protein QW680_14135 [Pyrobaculum sp.]